MYEKNRKGWKKKWNYNTLRFSLALHMKWYNIT